MAVRCAVLSERVCKRSAAVSSRMMVRSCSLLLSWAVAVGGGHGIGILHAPVRVSLGALRAHARRSFSSSFSLIS
eukprot:2459839-Rhodomonas_salina.1